MSPSLNEQELLKRLADLPREMRPDRDPWPEISARMERSGPAAKRTYSSAPGWMFRAAAASIFLVFAAGLLLKPLWNTDPLSPEERISHNTAAESGGTGPADTNGTPGLLDTAEAEYVAAFREFINVRGSPDNLTSKTIEKIEMGWTDLRVTETALAAALEENPGDLFLNERMLELRSRQLDILKQLITLDRSNRRMTI
jgi:hypothetical protein